MGPARSAGRRSLQLRWSGCGSFEARFPRVSFAFDPYLFNEHLSAAQPVYDFLFISHEHFDHCHPPTLRRLCRGERFRKLYVSPGCVSPAQPLAEVYGDAAFERDLPITKSIHPDRVQVVYPQVKSSLIGAERGFPPNRSLDLERIRIEVVESGEHAAPDLPTCGYLITDRETCVSIYHTGDLHEPYPELQCLAGRVDYLVHMKTGLSEWGGADQSARLRELVGLVQPRFLIPTHYRTDRHSDPIPHGTWPPDVSDANAFIEWIRAQVGDRTTILPFTAGVWYEVALPSLEVVWKCGIGAQPGRCRRGGRSRGLGVLQSHPHTRHVGARNGVVAGADGETWRRHRRRRLTDGRNRGYQVLRGKLVWRKNSDTVSLGAAQSHADI